MHSLMTARFLTASSTLLPWQMQHLTFADSLLSGTEDLASERWSSNFVARLVERVPWAKSAQMD